MADDTRQPADECCQNCTAWLVIDGADGIYGNCHAHPPVPLFGAHAKQPGPGVPKVEFFFPETESGDWCREFQKVTP